MQGQNNTNLRVVPPLPTRPAFSLPQIEVVEVPPIVVGCFVYVYDELAGQYLWQQVKAVHKQHGRLKINVAHTDFYFDAELVAAIAFLTGGGC